MGQCPTLESGALAKRGQRQRGDVRIEDIKRSEPWESRREQRPFVLLVCEGQETEPRYFRALFRDLRLPAPKIVGGDECGTDPASIVEYAVSHQEDEKYTSIWCVFDCDEHRKIPDARQRAQDCGFSVIFSNPCFEIWFLLHYRYNTKQLTRGQAQKECRKWLAGYSKSMDVYEGLRSMQEDAIAHARRLRDEHHARVNDGRPENPCTNVDVMIAALRELAE